MGRKYCSVTTCKNSSQTGTETYHRLPSNGDDRLKWITFLKSVNGQDYEPPNDCYTCSKHFKSCCFSDKGNERKRIMTGHYPTSTPEDSTPCIVIVELTDLEKLRSAYEKLQMEHSELLQTHKAILNELQALRQFRRRHQDCNLKRKIDTNDTSQEPKPKVGKAEEQLNFVARMTNGTHQKGSKYDQFTQEICYQLHYFSPRAYDFLRETVDKSLPHPRTFRKWTEYLCTAPGFIGASLEYIRTRNATAPYVINYALMLDEIHIRKHIVFTGKEFKGYINYGGIVEEPNTKIEATTALFILAVEINGNQKVPIGYILADKLKSSVTSKLIERSLEQMANVHARVLSVTFDGLASNFVSVENLGARISHLDLQLESPEPFVRHPTTGSKVFVVPDVCHMYKLLRNALKHFKVFVDGEGRMIEWRFLESLLRIQTESGLRAGNKLTKRHVNFETQKMKVKLCTQTLSNSVAVALGVCRKLQIPEFVGSEATSDFISLMNRLFDTMNSKSKGKGYKAPLRPSNKRLWLSLFDQAIRYLMNLKVPSPNGLIPLLISKRGTCIRGLVVGIFSLKMIMEEVVGQESYDLEYLSVYKLSQDHIELFFSSLRSRFGFNNNPSSVQVEQALKGMLTVNLKLGLNSNCNAQEDFVTKICPLKSLASLRSDELLNDLSCDEIPDVPENDSLTSFARNVVVYIAGYVGKAAAQRITCTSCLLALLPKEDEVNIDPDYTLILEKDNGGLFFPSSDVVNICRNAEAEIRRAQANGLDGVKTANVVQKTCLLCNEETIFAELRKENSPGHPMFSDHVLVLIRAICQEYVKIRLHHISRETSLAACPRTIRNTCTKAVHFAGN